MCQTGTTTCTGQARSRGTAGEASDYSEFQELVSLRIDRDILDQFQDAGPAWQEASMKRYEK
jgi:uncharacterized protein (DUF4415 family)